MSQSYPVRRAIMSVYNKQGILEFARALVNRGVELMATGGTARYLKDAGLKIQEISKYTNFPEIMDGRVKTLHPKIHGGILGRHGLDDYMMKHHAILPIDMVVVNFYPFLDLAGTPHDTLDHALKNIDIGGPAMVRSAAKNYKQVVIIVDNSDYKAIINEMDNNNSLKIDTRFKLAIKAFSLTAIYDNQIAHYLRTIESGDKIDKFKELPKQIKFSLIKKHNLRYGENYHQQAAIYVDQINLNNEASVATAVQLQGKPMSYNNLYDTNTALECVKEFSSPGCVIVKHANPCGVALGKSILEAYERAWKTDPTSAFGGVIAINRTLDEKTSSFIINNQFVEVIIAPLASSQAVDIIAKKPNIRLLICRHGIWQPQNFDSLDFKVIKGGILVQERDLSMLEEQNYKIVSDRQPTTTELADAFFSWKVAKFVKSNAIVYAKNNMTLGIGAGQTSRIYSTKIAHIKAHDEGLDLQGAVMASDAFLPFRDNIDSAASIGITCVIQTGGSIRDQEVIAAANQHHLAMIFTGIRHFRH
ncbi:MAG: bifunctional phosphoribosylaminoimidazolecarboxamide formyltransferase/IMP cyclohydrolase [Candidatus Dasytiphilus stammeri]